MNRGILAHGQVFERTQGKDDPRIFNWHEFMTRVNEGIAFTLNSPANLLVTDPQGRRVGVDPLTGQTLMEIPGATFTGAGTEPESITLPGGIDGQYGVQVTGTASGVFHLDVFAAGSDGEVMRTQVADVTSVGAGTTYSLEYHAQSGDAARFSGAANLPPAVFDDE